MALASVYIDIYITCIRLLISNILMILHSEIHTTQTKNKETKSILYKWLILATYLHSTKKILVHGKNAFKNKTPKSSFQTSSKNAANLWRAAKSQNSLAILKHTTGLYRGKPMHNWHKYGISLSKLLKSIFILGILVPNKKKDSSKYFLYTNTNGPQLCEIQVDLLWDPEKWNNKSHMWCRDEIQTVLWYVVSL